MIRRLVIPRLSWALVVAVAVFAAVAGFQLGGGTIPVVPTVDDELLYVGAAGLFGLGVFATMLKRPDVIGRITPTLYVVVALLPLLRFSIPGILIIRFLPLALMAPVVYSLYRDAQPVASHTRIARVAMFAAFATASSSLIANRSGTDYMRLVLMVGGIVLLVGAAPRAWSSTWQASVEKAVGIAWRLVVVSSVVLLPFSSSFLSERLRGAWESPNTLGALIALTTPIAAMRARFPVVYWLIAYTLSIASGSRGGLLALSVALVVVLIQRRRFIQLAALSLVGAGILSSGLVRLQSSHQETFGINTRRLVWEDVFAAFQNSPLTGYGFGAITDHVYSPQVQRWVGSSPQTHSSWLDGLYEQGVLAMVPWVFALLLGLRMAFRAGPMWGVTMLAGLVSATFESWMFAIGGGLGSLYWLIFGAAMLGARSKGAAVDMPAVVEAADV
ncbi:MAG: O-antigen ligase family protein [Acidimicrobiia bacterium]|nr:O-antigen ligase family protein [Acidimicrobiia bacterium]